MSNKVRNVTKQLLGAEDVAFGRGIVNQTRGGAVVPVHRLDLELPVVDEAELATTDTAKYPRASIGSRSFVAVNGQYQELSHILPVLYRVGGMISAEYPYCINDDVIAKWTGAFPKTLTVEDADFSGAGWQIYTVGSSRTIVSETQPPLSYGKQGFRWYNPTVPATYIYYNDGDSGQWVEEASQGADGALRSDLASLTSTVPIAGVPAKVLANQLIDIRTFGAVGDGIVDDTTPALNWLTALAANPLAVGTANGVFAINSIALNAPDGLTIVGSAKFKAIGSNRLGMVTLTNVQGLVCIEGITSDGSNIVARPFEIQNIGNATAGNVYIGPRCRFISAKNVAPRTDNSSGFRVQGKFNHVIFEGEVDGVDNSLTSGAVSVGAWFDWSGVDFIRNVVITSKARIKNVKNDNAVTADADGIQRMGPTTEHLSFTVEAGAYFENCKGRSIKSQVTNNTINAPVIVRNAYDGLIEIDMQYGGAIVDGAKIFYDNVKVLSAIGSTSRLNLPSHCSMINNVLTIKNPPASNTEYMCNFSSSDNTDTVRQEGLLCAGNKVIGGNVNYFVSVRCGNIVDSNRIVVRDNWVNGVGVSFINMFEMFNNPPHLSIVFEGNGSKTACTAATLTGSSRLRVESDKNNKNISSLPAWTETIASDTLTVYGGDFVVVDTEGAIATDNLSTITGGTYANGEILTLRSAANGRTVVVKNGIGNIFLAGSDFSLDNVKDRLRLSFDSALNAWCEVSRANNG